MRKLTFLLICILSTTFIFAQDESQTPTPNYRLAAKFSPNNLGKLVHSTTVQPNWLKTGNRFWYQYKTTEGSSYYIVDPDRRTRTKLFDNAKMAKWLTEITKDPYDAQHLPRFNFEFVKNDTAIRFRVTSNEEVEAKDDEKENEKKADSTKAKKKKKPKMEKKVYYLEYRLGGNGLTIIDNSKDDEKRIRWANVAPDSSIVLFSKKHNLYWMDKENFLKAVEDEKDSTIVEHQWTTDGVEHFGYGGGGRGQTNVEKEKTKDDRKGVFGLWSHDSKKFVLQRTDSRHIKDLWVINSATKDRPTLESYKYHMAGEQEFYKSEVEIFDVSTKAITNIKLDTTVQQSVSIYRAPIKKSNFDDDFKPSLLLSKKGKVYFNTISRDRKKLDIHVADINTGEVTTLINEHSNTYIENISGQSLRLFNNENGIIAY